MTLGSHLLRPAKNIGKVFKREEHELTLVTGERSNAEREEKPA